MSTTEHLRGAWLEWRHAHVSEMFRPYGWTSLIAQYWMREGDEGRTFDHLPGTWSVRDGRVLYTPTEGAENLSVGGEYPEKTAEIIPGRNQTYGHGDSVPVYAGECEVETIVRSTTADQALYGVRVRDPKMARVAHEVGVSAFEYDPAWRVPAVFTPFDRVEHEAETVEEGVRETTPLIGTLRFSLHDQDYEVVVLGKDTAAGVQPVVHFRDDTSGPITYGAGRVVEVDFTGAGTADIDWIDFNYAVALPCAFTNFVTCPLPPRENYLPTEVRAGEKKPTQGIERQATFAVV